MVARTVLIFCARITIIFVRSIIINQHNIGHKVFFNSIVYEIKSLRIFRIQNFEVEGFHSSCKFQISHLALF